MSQVSPEKTGGDGKRCPDCDLTKPLGDFPRNSTRRDEGKAMAEGRTIRDRRELPPGERYCPDCKTIQPLDDFPRNRSGREGRGGYCKPCHNARTAATKQRLYGSTRDYHLRARYGITSADVDAMVERQGGTCAVCDGKPEHVDHDHATGKVRGILCFNCNQALGNARDDIAVLRGLINYLRLHRLQSLPITMVESPVEGVVFEYLARHRSA